MQTVNLRNVLAVWPLTRDGITSRSVIYDCLITVVTAIQAGGCVCSTAANLLGFMSRSSDRIF
jgi:hypothetical protein